MIGCVIVTHGRLGEELRLAMEHVVGKQDRVYAVCVGSDDDLGTLSGLVASAVEAADTGDGVVLLTDMFGGSPSNLCVAQMKRDHVEVVGGVNLPMLVKFSKVRQALPLSEAVRCMQAAGRKYIGTASEAIPHCLVRADGLSRHFASVSG